MRCQREEGGRVIDPSDPKEKERSENPFDGL